MKVVVLRGIPGSGKSTYAMAVLKAQVPTGDEGLIVSADRYFEHDKQYRFDPTKLREAHQQCQRNYLYAVSKDYYHMVVVDNTNVKAEDMAIYVDVAIALEHDLDIVTFVCPPALGHKRNVHGVPLSTCVAMATTLGIPLPKRWRAYERTIAVSE